MWNVVGRCDRGWWTVAGDIPAGFAEFVSSRYASLVRSAFLLVGDRGHAEDLVQSALAGTFAAWDRLRAVEAAESYTRTTMVRLAGRWGHRRWRGEAPDEQVTVRPGVAGPVSAVERGLDLRMALAQLPLPQRTVLVLRYFDDLSEAETARALGCSVGTVKSRASRGLASLRSAGLLDPPVLSEVRDG